MFVMMRVDVRPALPSTSHLWKLPA